MLPICTIRQRMCTTRGFDLKIKDLQIYPNGAKKADWDVGLSIDAVKLADKVDAVVIVSGDGDYIPLLTYLRENKGCTIEVMAFGETTNTKLKEEADAFIDLSKDKRRFLMSMSSAKRAANARYSSASRETSVDRAIAALEDVGAVSVPSVMPSEATRSQRTTSTASSNRTSRTTATRKTGTRSATGTTRAARTASNRKTSFRGTIKKTIKK
jgi:hypothetical protein